MPQQHYNYRLSYMHLLMLFPFIILVVENKFKILCLRVWGRISSGSLPWN